MALRYYSRPSVRGISLVARSRIYPIGGRRPLQDIGYRPRYCPPRPLRLMVWACLDRPWSLPPPEPRVRPLVGHFRLASKGT